MQYEDWTDPSRRLLIIGNSGSGKTTLARAWVDAVRERRSSINEDSPGPEPDHLDLDHIAWRQSTPTERRPLADSLALLKEFTSQPGPWVVEGCYGDLLAAALPACDGLLFANPGVDACIRNCQARPWEPTKYASPGAQQRNLDMLLDWVRQYPEREDEFSLARHREIFRSCQQPRLELESNEASRALVRHWQFADFLVGWPVKAD